MHNLSDSLYLTPAIVNTSRNFSMSNCDNDLLRMAAALEAEKSESLADPRALTSMLQERASAHILFGEFAQAYSFALRAKKIATLHKFEKELACSQIQLGNCLVASGNFEKALPYLSVGLQIYTALDHYAGKLNALSAFGCFHLAQGQYEMMFAYTQQALKVFKPADSNDHCTGFLASIADGHAHFAAGLVSQGKVFQASTHVSKALRFLHSFIGVESQRFVDCADGRVVDILARLYLLRDEPAKSLSCALTLMRSGRHLKSSRLLGNAFDRLADLRRAQGKLRSAVKWLMRSKACWERLGLHRERVLSLESLSNCFGELGQHDKALKFFKAAKQLEAQARCLQSELRAEMMAIEMKVDSAQHEDKEAQEHSHRLALLGRMVSSVTHEITQPISAIRLLAENALMASHAIGLEADSPSPTGVQESFSKIVHLAEVLTRYADDLKRFSRREPMQVVPVTLKYIVNNAIAIAEPKRKSCGATLVVDVGDVGDVAVLADAGRTSAIVVNLLCNAFDAVSDTANRKVCLSAQEFGTRVQIRIRDFGYGLHPEALARLFEPFYTTKMAGKGLGLGLSLAMDMAQQMGAFLEGGNHLEGGAEFILDMQVANVYLPSYQPPVTLYANINQPLIFT